MRTRKERGGKKYNYKMNEWKLKNIYYDNNICCMYVMYVLCVYFIIINKCVIN